MFTMMGKQKSYTWDELNILEEKRRTFLDYDGKGFYYVLFRHYSGTVLDYILWDPLFWVVVVVFLGVRIYDNYDDDLEPVDVIPGPSSVTSIGAFLSFILTFFVNQTISDFSNSYNTSMKAKGTISEMATLGGSVLPMKRATKIVRLLNAAHLVGYCVLSDTYGRENFFDPLNKEMQVLTEKELINVDELDRELKEGINCWEIIMWAMEEIEDALEAGDIDSRTAGSLRSIVVDFRGAMSSLYNDADQPSVTFFYFHLVAFLCLVYLPLFAIYHGLNASENTNKFTVGDVVSFLVVFVESCFVIGMRLLAMKLLAPYGDNTESLRVITFVRTGWQSSNKILEVKQKQKRFSSIDQKRMSDVAEVRKMVGNGEDRSSLHNGEA